MVFYFFIAIFLVVFVIISYKSDNFQYIKDYFSKNIKKIIFFIFTNIIFLLPFLSVYLEKATETGMHHWSDSHYFSPHIYDIFNIGSFNIYPIFLHYCLDIFHNCINNKNHISNMNYVYSEFSSGFPPITLLISFLGIINKIRLLENKEKIFYQSFFVANIIVFILPLRLGIISPWHLVYSIVPGAKGLRVVVRFFLFETFPICIGLACFYDMLEKTKKRYFFLFLSFLIIIEQVNYSPVYNLSRNSSLNIQKSIPKKPETCKVFFVIDKPFDEKITSSDISKNTYDLYHANVFAMFYSELHNTPTIAGFSTFNPPDWNFASPYQDAVPLKPIIERALQYAHKHQITDSSLCYIDLRVNKWVKLKE
ncbi:MAG: hypothetical protein ABF772_06720 [Acetobacter orientalis]|uniref:hypothetical protein n=2 Tax=Acetobacter orientalis TaxID=146474 RepID=UPI0039EBF048